MVLITEIFVFLGGDDVVGLLADLGMLGALLGVRAILTAPCCQARATLKARRGSAGALHPC